MKQQSKLLAPLSVVAAFLVLAAVLLSMSYLPLMTRALIVMIVTAITMVILLVTKKPIWRYLTAIVIVVASIVIGVTQLFVNKMVEEKPYEIVEYSAYRYKDRNLKTPANVAFFGVKNEHKEELTTQMMKSQGWNQYTVYSDGDKIIQDFKDGVIDVVMINQAMLGNLTEAMPSFDQDTIFIESFNIELKRDSIVKAVDITQEPYTVYVSGIDVFGDVVTRSRSDMNVLLTVNPKTHSVLSVTIPRDTYVPLACEKGEMDKITHAGLYGVSCSVQTIEKLLDIDVNYYVRVNFTGLVNLVDALDGIDVLAHQDFETESGYAFKEGVNHLNGEQALAFARERDNVEFGDISRGFNHQELIKAIFNKAIQPEYIVKYPQLSVIINDVIDTNIDDASLSRLISKQLSASETWEFHEDYLLGEGDMQPTHSQDANYKYYVYWPDEASVESIHNQIEALMTMPKEE